MNREDAYKILKEADEEYGTNVAYLYNEQMFFKSEYTNYRKKLVEAVSGGLLLDFYAFVILLKNIKKKEIWNKFYTYMNWNCYEKI